MHQATATTNVAAAGGGGRRRSPHYRTQGPGCAWLSAPAVTASLFPEVAKRAGESPTRKGRAGEEVRGPAATAAAGGGGEQARPGRGGAPRSSVAHRGVTTRKRRPLTARPSFSRRSRTPPPPSTTVAAALSALPAVAEARAHTARPCRRPAHTQQGPTAGPSLRASPPSPRLHSPL